MLDLARDEADEGADGAPDATARPEPPTRSGGSERRRSDDLEFFVGAGLATLASAAFWGAVLYGLAALVGLAG